MKTYKLIKTYPGSFPLGHLAILDESVKYYNLGTTTRSLDYIETIQKIGNMFVINVMKMLTLVKHLVVNNQYLLQKMVLIFLQVILL